VLDDRQRAYYKKWDKIEQKLTISKRISKKLLDELEKAYKQGITIDEQEKIINSVYRKLFKSDMEV
jgi:predicted lipase